MARRVFFGFLAAGTLFVSGCEINTKIDADGAVNGPQAGNGNGNGNGNGDGNGNEEADGRLLLFLVEAECGFLWDLSGTPTECSSCDMAFQLSATNAGGDCGDISGFSGDMVVGGDAVYFNGSYWGALIEEGGGYLYWYTYDYIAGESYDYIYAGYLDY